MDDHYQASTIQEQVKHEIIDTSSPLPQPPSPESSSSPLINFFHAKHSLLLLVLMIGGLGVLVLGTTQAITVFTHAGTSLFSNCTPIPSGMTAAQIQSLGSSGKVRWCSSNLLGTATNWYNSAWLYRSTITISNTNNTNQLTNYEVPITLNATNFNFSQAQSLGQDIRFTDTDGATQLPYWIENYNASAKTATMYVKVPSIPASSTYTIYLYYGNPTAADQASGPQTFTLYDGFETPLTNATTHQNIPTPDGTGQNTEPGVISFAPNSWNGYTYWMSTTGYYHSNERLENPGIVASNDGVHWVVPTGVTNPLVPAPVCDHNSDTTLLYNPSTNELWMYYNDTRRAALCSGYQTQPWYNHNYVDLIKSSDGIHWSAPTTVLTWDLGTNMLFMSPSVVVNNGTYYLWTSGFNGEVERFTSTDGVNWGTGQLANIPNSAWHLNAIYVPSKSEYWMLTDYASTSGSLRFIKSTDGVNWTDSTAPVMLPTAGWDQNLYRSTLLYDQATNKIRVWYSAYDNKSNWYTGYSENDYDNFLHQFPLTVQPGWTQVQGNGTWTRSTAQTKRGSFSGQITQAASTSMILEKPNPLANNFYQEWDMYDDMNTSAFKIVRSSNSSNKEVGMGVWTGSSSTNYVYHSTSFGYTVTSVARTQGWHKFGMLIKSDSSVTFFIDGRNVGTLTNQFNNATQVRIEGYYGGQTTYYVDDIRVRQYTNPEPTVTFTGGSTGIGTTPTTTTTPTLQPSVTPSPTPAPTPVPYYNQVLNDGAVGYFRLSDTSTTASNSKGSPTGSYINSPTHNQSGALKTDSNASTLFNGTNQYVDIPYSTTLSNYASFSIEAWAYVTGGSGAYRGIAADRKYPDGWVLYANSSNQWAFWINNGTGMSALTGPAISYNTWVHLVGTYDSSTKTATFYVNGQKVSSAAISSYTRNPQNHEAIAAGEGGTSAFFPGKVDEVAFYNTALTATQVANHYTSAGY